MEINGIKSNVGVVCMLMATPTIQHLCCTLIENPQCLYTRDVGVHCRYVG